MATSNLISIVGRIPIYKPDQDDARVMQDWLDAHLADLNELTVSDLASILEKAERNDAGQTVVSGTAIADLSKTLDRERIKNKELFFSVGRKKQVVDHIVKGYNAIFARAFELAVQQIGKVQEDVDRIQASALATKSKGEAWMRFVFWLVATFVFLYACFEVYELPGKGHLDHEHKKEVVYLGFLILTAVMAIPESVFPVYRGTRQLLNWIGDTLVARMFGKDSVAALKKVDNEKT